MRHMKGSNRECTLQISLQKITIIAQVHTFVLSWIVPGTSHRSRDNLSSGLSKADGIETRKVKQSVLFYIIFLPSKI